MILFAQFGRFGSNAGSVRLNFYYRRNKAQALQRCSRSDTLLDMSVKEQVLQAIQRLPDDIDFRDVADEIALTCSCSEGRARH